MIDFTHITGFDWDEGNSRKSSEKHAVSQAEAEQVFFSERRLTLVDVKHSQAEQRFQLLGRTHDGRHLYVTVTLRQNMTKIRVISARDMNRKERARYEQEA